jgi:hypothetical protein
VRALARARPVLEIPDPSSLILNPHPNPESLIRIPDPNPESLIAHRADQSSSLEAGTALTTRTETVLSTASADRAWRQEVLVLQRPRTRIRDSG